MKLQQMYSLTRKAIDDFQMIEENDCIALGISGGKDSMALLYILAGLKKFYPKKFTLIGVTIDLGFDNLNLTKIQETCDNLNVPYEIIKTDIADIVFHQRKETSPCSLCAKMRKGALNDAMKKLGCNKVAYAHHKDDVVDTMMLSLLYEGRFHSFLPVTYLDRSEITVIRPFLYVNERDVIGFINKYQIPIVKSPCPVDKKTKREYVKNLIRSINEENPDARERMFTAVMRGLYGKE
jgi:tRNA 2-thiocytidine biosynthesis protein TtcA